MGIRVDNFQLNFYLSDTLDKNQQDELDLKFVYPFSGNFELNWQWRLL